VHQRQLIQDCNMAGLRFYLLVVVAACVVLGIQALSTDEPRLWRYDLRCGPNFPLEDPLKKGQAAQCNPNGKYPCCSFSGWCGNTAQHCDCIQCTDYRDPEEPRTWRDDHRCGCDSTGSRANLLLFGDSGQHSCFQNKYGELATCRPDSIKPCCSKHGWCGNTDAHCQSAPDSIMAPPSCKDMWDTQLCDQLRHKCSTDEKAMRKVCQSTCGFC